MTDRMGQVAVVFLSQRRAGDDDAYGVAATAMEALAAEQPGYRGVDSARGADGFGITVSWWADEAAAVAWRRHPVHAAIRDAGRADWYERYEVAVAGVDRSYRWVRPGPDHRRFDHRRPSSQIAASRPGDGDG